jgi:hypothetical protein
VARKKVTEVPEGTSPPAAVPGRAPLTGEQLRHAIRLILLNNYQRTGKVLHTLVICLRGGGFGQTMVEEVKAEMRAAGELPPEGEIQLHREG